MTSITSTTNTVTDTGTTELNVGTLTLTGNASHTVNLSSDSRVALGYTTSAGGATGTDTITLSGGADTLNLNFGVVKNSTVTLGAGADTVFIATAYLEGTGAGGTIAGGNVAGTAAATITFSTFGDFAKGVDHINVELGAAGMYTNTFGNGAYIGAASLTAAATTAGNLAGTGNSTVFEFNGNSYIFQDANGSGSFNAGDVLVQLTGVTGLSVNSNMSATSTGDIHFG